MSNHHHNQSHNQNLTLKEHDFKGMVYAGMHIGDPSVNSNMRPYVYKRTQKNGVVINLKDTWNNLNLAARILAGIENPSDILVASSSLYGTRAVLKFAHFTGAVAVAGRYAPGTLTNQIEKAFKEPRIIVVNDPMTDHRIVRESAYVGIPVIAFCNTSAPLTYVDLAIPCNNTSQKSAGLMWWLLCRQILRMKGKIGYDGAFNSMTATWDIMPDLFMYRSPQDEIPVEEVNDEEEADKANQAGANVNNQMGGNYMEGGAPTTVQHYDYQQNDAVAWQ